MAAPITEFFQRKKKKMTCESWADSCLGIISQEEQETEECLDMIGKQEPETDAAFESWVDECLGLDTTRKLLPAAKGEEGFPNLMLLPHESVIATAGGGSITGMDDKELHRVLIASIVSLCDRATIDMGSGIDRAIRSIISVSLKYLDRKSLLSDVVPGGYVDWDYVDSSHSILGNKQNLLGDSDIWLHLLPYIDFGKLSLEQQELKSLHPPIWTLYRTMEEHVGHSGLWSFNDTCKLFLLSNLIGIPFKYVAERYTSKTLKESSLVVCGKIMENMAEERHDSNVYLQSMQYLLSGSSIDTASIDLHIEHYRNTMADQKASWTLKHMRVQSRPSMRSILATKRITSGIKNLGETYTDNHALGVITFDAFCNLVRFPNCMSHLLRSRCYLLACQTHFDFSQHTHRLVSDEIAQILNSNPVTCPDEASLNNCISMLTLNIHPFEELLNFRKDCFTSYADNQSNQLTMTDVLKMYVAAYQNSGMWKQLWKAIHPLMSTQISKDVENFVRQHRFATEKFVDILKTSTPFSIQSI